MNTARSVAPEASDALRGARAQVLVLAAAQALFQTVGTILVTVGALAGHLLASDPAWATAPMASLALGTTLTTVPASWFMARFGRRLGFALGALLGGLGGILSMGGLSSGSLVLLSLGTMLIGSYQAFAQFYRFAAAEAADDGFRPRAIAWVLGGGVVAAIVGPELAQIGTGLFDQQFLGSFLILTVLCVLGACCILAGFRPGAAARADGASAGKRPLQEIMAQPAYLVALFSAATSFGVMILAMTATPLAMVHDHHSMGDVARVIQAHVLAMFLPSFFTGGLVARFGVFPVMLTGILLLAGHIAMALSGTSLASFIAALTLLGTGWNFLYVASTTLLTETYTQSERASAQGANDLVVFATGLVSSLAAGMLLSHLGWQLLNMVLLPWLGACALAILWLAQARRHQLKATR